MEQSLEQNPAINENLLDDAGVDLVHASGGTRFSNLLIDGIIRYLLWRFLLAPLTGVLIVAMGLYYDTVASLTLESYVFAIVYDIFFLTLQEAALGGKTIGKFITRTRAVNVDGTPINFRKALLRSVSRAVPFEAFSALGSPCYPWHDRWTSTLVIDEKASRLPM
jgi:uncharacterized RDD family membrane protein YckC